MGRPQQLGRLSQDKVGAAPAAVTASRPGVADATDALSMQRGRGRGRGRGRR